MTTVHLLQLYPDELGVAGDRGNVMALTARLERAGIEASVSHHRAGLSLPDDPDLVIVGNGPLSAIRNIYADLQSHAEQLRSWASAGVPIFAYGAGAELLGEGITLVDGSVIAGLGIFPFRAARTQTRNVGYVLVESSVGQVAGFEDNASQWRLSPGADAFGALVAGSGNGDGKSEGVRLAESIATQVGGPVLPLNPALTDSLLRAIARRKGFSYEPGAAHAELDRLATGARAVIVDNVKHVFSRI
ncbi:type 1 glutamine amidotransferase [Parafrigoribacterium soli]|uniref:type 1 glutamine amidotransferase n=1 Tax=Parafrigoribacterium soli TaxID=3144663 RepID=UPI0032ED9E45